MAAPWLQPGHSRPARPGARGSRAARRTATRRSPRAPAARRPGRARAGAAAEARASRSRTRRTDSGGSPSPFRRRGRRRRRRRRRRPACARASRSAPPRGSSRATRIRAAGERQVEPAHQLAERAVIGAVRLPDEGQRDAQVIRRQPRGPGGGERDGRRQRAELGAEAGAPASRARQTTPSAASTTSANCGFMPIASPAAAPIQTATDRGGSAACARAAASTRYGSSSSVIRCSRWPKSYPTSGSSAMATVTSQARSERGGLAGKQPRRGQLAQAERAGREADHEDPKRRDLGDAERPRRRHRQGVQPDDQRRCHVDEAVGGEASRVEQPARAEQQPAHVVVERQRRLDLPGAGAERGQQERRQPGAVGSRRHRS